MTFTEDIINSTNVSNTTKALRISYLKRFNLTKENVCDVLSDVNIIRRSTSGKPNSLNTILANMWHVLSFLKALLDKHNEMAESILPINLKYAIEIERVNAALQKVRRDNKKKASFVSLEELQSKLHDTKDFRELITDYETYALLSLYVDTPALRNDYGNMKIVKNISECTDDANYLVYNKRDIYLILSVYKTVVSFGKLKRIDLEDATKQAIRELLNYRKSTGVNSEYLFSTNSRVGMVQRIKRASKIVFGEPYSINVYRHAWETHIQHRPDYASLTLAERDALHHRLLHHMNVALEYNLV
jgi:hypothetical protein